jgi:hypothetical protein
MALIWADGMEEAKALAPAWARWQSAAAKAGDLTLPPAEIGQAALDLDKAKKEYERLVWEAEQQLKARATDGNARTHFLIVGVGRYQSQNIPTVSTSVHGATEFAKWALTEFAHLDRPLGSIEMVLSPSAGPWVPSESSEALAKKLGLANGEAFPLPPATFENVELAFKAMVRRGQIRAENAVLFYFAGHGLWKQTPYVLPQDAELADAHNPFINVIDPYQTLKNMLNTQPATQCFFLESCQELTSEFLDNLSESPGKPLWDFVNAPRISKRDNIIYHSSYIGARAKGLPNQAPLFTKELLNCLRTYGARNQVGTQWSVTSASLEQALGAAAEQLSETLKDASVGFSSTVPGQKTFESELCYMSSIPEVLLRVRCRPQSWMGRITPYVMINGVRVPRPTPKATDWVVTAPLEPCRVGADELPPLSWTNTEQRCNPRPPVEVVTLSIPLGGTP